MTVQNYTAEMTAELVNGYTALESDEARANFVEEMAAKFEKSVPSVRAKLVREKAYVKPAEDKSSAAVRKDALVAAIARLTNSEEEELESLSKATKQALTIVYGRLNALAKETVEVR